MEKEKKSIQENLVANSLIFTILSIAAIILGLFFFFYGIFFSVLAISGLSGEFAVMSFLQAGLFLAGSFIIFYIFARNSKWLWAQWQRKQAIDAEDKRISRLVDDASMPEDKQFQEEELGSEKTQGRP